MRRHLKRHYICRCYSVELYAGWSKMFSTCVDHVKSFATSAVYNVSNSQRSELIGRFSKVAIKRYINLSGKNLTFRRFLSTVIMYISTYDRIQYEFKNDILLSDFTWELKLKTTVCVHTIFGIYFM